MQWCWPSLHDMLWQWQRGKYKTFILTYFAAVWFPMSRIRFMPALLPESVQVGLSGLGSGHRILVLPRSAPSPPTNYLTCTSRVFGLFWRIRGAAGHLELLKHVTWRGFCATSKESTTVDYETPCQRPVIGLGHKSILFIIY